MKTRFKNIIGFLWLILFFLVPVLFRAIDRNFEVFPSVTLPSNANQVFAHRKTGVIEQHLYGIDAHGNRQKLDHQAFFEKIPIPYSHWIIRNDFGLDRNKPVLKTTARLGLAYTKKPKVTSDEVVETKEWIRQQLRAQGLADSVLIIRKNHIFLSHGRPNPIDHIRTNDTIIALH